MEKPKSKGGMLLILGAILIATGFLFLLNNYEIITLDWDFLMGPLFGLGGLIFLLVFMVNTDDWWALLPGMALISLGLIIFMGQSDFENDWVGALFLGMLGLSYLFNLFIPSGSLVGHYPQRRSFHSRSCQPFTCKWWAFRSDILPGTCIDLLAGVLPSKTGW